MWGRARASPLRTCPSSSSFSPVRRNLTIIVVLRMKFNDSATLRRTLTYRQPTEPTDASQCGDDAIHSAVCGRVASATSGATTAAAAKGNASFS